MKTLAKETKWNNDGFIKVCQGISNEILKDVRGLDHSERYKIFAQTIIGKNEDQGIKVGAKCV